MQMQPLESQTGPITETEYMCACVCICVCAHKYDSFFSIGHVEYEALFLFEAHNPSLMSAAH